MGVRLYNPATGRFLSVDPVPGGNANAYEYCTADSVNCVDIDGRWGWGSVFKAVGHAASAVGHAAVAAYRNPIGHEIINMVAMAAATAVVCGATAGIGCAVAVGFVVGAVEGAATYGVSNTHHTVQGFVTHALVGGVKGAVSNGAGAFGKAFTKAWVGNLTYKTKAGRLAFRASWQSHRVRAAAYHLRRGSWR